MCSPLQAVVMGQWLRTKNRYRWLIYHAGRISTYIVLGLLVGLIGEAAGIPQWQGSFTIIAGVVLLLGYALIKILKWDRKIFTFISPVLIRAQNKVRKGGGGAPMTFLSGSLNGLLPCGMVYAALLPVASLNSSLNSMGYMLAFGLGTLPLQLVANFTLNSFGRFLGRHSNKVIPITVVFISSLLILRGMELDIPYISPATPAATDAAAAGCK